MRSVNALASVAQQLFNGLAVALATIVLHVGEPLADLVTGGAGTHSAYVVAFIMLTAVAVVGAWVAWRFPPSAGEGLTRTQPEPA